MPTTTKGTFFLRQRGTEVRPAAGADEFRLTLRVLDKHKHGSEGYVVTWKGAAACNWWAEHGSRVRPGQPLLLELAQPRCLPVLGGAPEITATVVSCQLAPEAPSWQTHQQRAAAPQPTHGA